MRRLFYWFMKHIILGPLLRVIYRLRAEGLENVPAEGPAILTPNHLSFVDSLFMPLVVKRKVVFLGKSDYFDSWRTRWFMKAVGVIPVRREGGSASEAAIRTGIQALKEGNLVAIYPEGTRSPDGRLYRGKTGVARMALEAQAPVIPISLDGTAAIMPIDRKVPKFGGTVTVRFGKALTFERFYDRPQDRFVLRSVTDEIMYEIMLISGQEYVDEYAAKVKDQMKEAARPAEVDERTPTPTEPAPRK